MRGVVFYILQESFVTIATKNAERDLLLFVAILFIYIKGVQWFLPTLRSGSSAGY